MLFFEKIKPHFVFLFAALFFQWHYFVNTPPLQAPDEINHFYRVWQISEGQFSPYKENERLGGWIPEAVRHFVKPYENAATNIKYTISDSLLCSSYQIKNDNERRVFIDFPNTALYSVVSYAPQALAMYIARQFDYSIGKQYDAGRRMIFIVWLILFTVIIWLLPFGNWIMCFVGLLPMQLFITNSFSADTITNILSLLFVSFVLYITYRKKSISLFDLVLLGLILILLVQAKVVYSGLALLLLIIPKSHFKTIKWYWLSQGILFFTTIVTSFIWSGIVMDAYMPYSEYNPGFRNYICLSNCANYFAQKELILGNFWYFPQVIYRSIFDHPYSYLQGFIGIFGNSDIFLDKSVIKYSYLALGIVALTGTNQYKPKFKHRIVIFTAALCAVILLLLSQHLVWDCVGEGIVDLIQGRYLIPIIPVMVMAVLGKGMQPNFLAPLSIFILSFIIHHVSTSLIHDRYFVDSYTRKMEYYSGAEKATPEKTLYTNDKEVFFRYSGYRSDSVRRSGKYSLPLFNDHSFGFSYEFHNLKYGELIEIEGWQKGRGAQIVISGHGKGCKEFYKPNSEVIYYDKRGWGYMDILITNPYRCDSSSCLIFVWNPDTSKAVFFDDYKVTRKWYKDNYLDTIEKKSSYK